MNWEPIESAPKDGTVVLVNDTTCTVPWAAAKWLEGDEWSGWVYDDDVLLDCNPTGPEPTHWFPLPPLPQTVGGGALDVLQHGETE